MSSRPLVLIPQFFGCLLFDRRSARYLAFDSETTAALRELAAGRFFEHLARHPQSAEALQGLFFHLEAQGYLDPGGSLTAQILEATPPPGHLLGPLAVHLEAVASCNLSCEHCFAAPLPRQGAQLSLTELDSLFVELAAMGSFRLGVTGGEPLVRGDLFELLDAALARGLHPCVTTNGTLLDEVSARAFGHRDRVWLNVSLDGATAATNDAIRGPGTFALVRERLALLRRHARFSLAFTLTTSSADEIEACAELARSVGAQAAVFRPLYPVGRARGRPDLMASFAAYANALGRLGASTKLGEELCIVDSFGPRWRAPEAAKVHRGNGCGAANTVASISASGEVSPCSFLGPAFVAGSLRESSFRLLWNQGAPFCRLRENRGAFAGGCRARAMAFAGNAEDADPWQLEHALTPDSVNPSSNLESARERP